MIPDVTEQRRGGSALWLAALLLALSLPSHALAWSDFGHRIVCEIAFREVRPETRQRIKELIRQDKEFKRFSDACTWPDHPRSRPTEHYVEAVETRFEAMRASTPIEWLSDTGCPLQSETPAFS